MSKKVDKPEEKQYKLKDIERNMLANMESRHRAAQLDFLTFVSLERLNLEVTPNTNFRVDADGWLFISEREEKKEEVEVSTNG